MRILTISNVPALEHLGSGYVLSGFVKGLRALGHEIDLVQPDDHEVLQSMRPRANAYRQAVGMLRATRRALARQRYDVVEFWGGEAWLATWGLHRRRQRPLIVQHTNGPEPRYNTMLRTAGLWKPSLAQRGLSRLQMKAFELADGVVTVSRYDGDWLEQMSLPRSGNRITVEAPLPDEFLGRPTTVRGSRTIGFCGTWLPKKGLGVLVPDMSRVLREFPEWRFLVLGAGDRGRVHASFPEELRGRIEVVPMIGEKEALAQQYERMEIFVFPSVIESFGIALAEAMACGCAPVTTRVGFGASLDDGRHALLLSDAASPQLYESIKRLVLDEPLRKAIGAAAQARVQSLDWGTAARGVADAYQSWAAERGRDASAASSSESAQC